MIGLANVLLMVMGAIFGFAIAWLLVRPNAAVLNSRLSALQQELTKARLEAAKFTDLNAQLNAAKVKLETTVALERKANDEKLAILNQMTQELRDSFQALSAEALKSNNQAFLHLAQSTLEKFQSEAKGDLELRQQAVEDLVAPIGESLKKVDDQIRQMESVRDRAYGDLTSQVRSLIITQEKLQSETGNLVRALRTPTVRGQWGEIQLRRVVEMAGMLPYCDFVEQETITAGTGKLRPDLIVKLAGGKNIVVDVKTPLQAYLEAVESTDDETRRRKLQDHARQVRTHMNQLSSKGYWEQFESSPEFVVMFLPGEAFFSASLEQDPGLIESGVGQRVILASPTTLIALLKAVAYGWNQEKLARNAQEISALGKELHDRLRLLGSHIDNVGKGLDRAVESYNKAVGSLESRVMVSARKFVELGAPVTDEIAELNPIETTTRNLTLDFDDPEKAEAGASVDPGDSNGTGSSRKALTASKASD
ncbi:MAG: rmuC [Candidatus Angelobacter sp.]|nr:rmuC [Candidatus Angelobacter sp.]